MENFYEVLGRKQEIIDKQHVEYMNLLNALREIKAGNVSLDRVTVGADSWSVSPATEVK